MLDRFGKIAAAEIAFYTPLFFIAFFIVLRHGFRRHEGWIYLFTFCSIRIVGAALTIASKVSSTSQVGLAIAATVLSGIGLSPLLLATQGFITKLAENGLPLFQRSLRLSYIILIVALILGAVGGSAAAPGNSASSVASGRTLVRVSVVQFMVAYAILLGLHVNLWGASQNLQPHFRKLLAGVSLALPPLFVRLVYAILGAFASSTQSRWSPIFGDWRIYLTMSLIMEFLTAVTYVVTGVLIPAQKDVEAKAKGQVSRMGRMPVQGV